MQYFDLADDSLGSLADIGAPSIDVRLAPRSGRCPVPGWGRL